MVKSLLLVIAILVTSSFEVTPSYAAGCGYHTVYGQVLCRDYKGRSVSTSHCNKYTSEIGPRPPVPSTSCPNPCCTETHTVDGVVVDSEVKVAGSCSSTSRTTTCEERGDCPPPTPTPTPTPTPVTPSPVTPPPVTPPPVTPTPTSTCTPGTRIENGTRDGNCPHGQDGSFILHFERTVTTNVDCTISVSDWTLLRADNTCSEPQTSSSCTTPWGAIVPHGSSVTAYQNASVGCVHQAQGKQCGVFPYATEIRTCSNGSLSGSYPYPGCGREPNCDPYYQQNE